MRLKKLELVGFKSFLEKTSFDFTADMTGIVGPNGCGKSNVVDAIKWVTGELSFKELRGRSMQDLIFTGSELRAPTGMAEVALTLDNSDGSGPEIYREFSEITVTRRIFRDGSSEFFINKTACRLRDVVDIFLDTGVGDTSYSIIEQGRVGQIVASKPEDRRMIIEEAAGITKYKHRKKAAERKMDYTRQNLLRVSDVLTELKRQIGSLERQAKKAEKYREVSERVRSLDLTLTSTSYQNLKADLLSLDSNESTIAAELDQSQVELIAKEAQIEKSQLELVEIEKVVQIEQQKLMDQGTELSHLENQIENAKREASSLKEQSVRERARAEELFKEVSRLEEALVIADHGAVALQKERETLSQELQVALEAESKTHVALALVEREVVEKQESLLGIVSQEAELKNKIVSQDTRSADFQKRLGERDREAEAIGTEIEKLEQEYETRKRELSQAIQLKFGFEKEQADTQEKLSELENKREELEKKIIQSEQKLEGLKSRLSTLEEFQKTYQGYDQGVRSIMETKGGLPFGSEILGLLGELVRPERGFERAVEAILDTRLKHFVVKAPRSSLQAIEYLKTANQGRASFVAIEGRQVAQDLPLPAGDGVLGALRTFVSVSKDLETAVDSILHNVVVVKELKVAMSLWEEGKSRTYVTVDGDVVSMEGVVTGGSWGDQRGVLETQGEISELREVIAQLAVENVEVSKELTRVTHEISQMTLELGQLERSLSLESQKAATHEKDFGRLEEALHRLKGNLELILLEKMKIQEEILGAAKHRDQFAEELQTWSQRRSEKEQSLTAKQSEATSTKQLLQAQVSQLTELKVKQASLDEKVEGLTREKQHLTTQLQNTRSAHDRGIEESIAHEARSAELEAGAQKMTGERESIVQAYAAQQTKVSHERGRYETLSHTAAEEALKVKAIRDEVAKHQESLNALRLKIQEEKMRLEYMTTQIFERYAVQLADYISSDQFSPLGEESLEGAKQDLQERKDQLLKIGDVNLSAIEELKELSERYSFLSHQKEDLENSLEALSQAIKKINATTKDLFSTTFESVNEKFKVIFPKLFRGGKAQLVLTEPENLLETGVEIVAQPPGKRLQNMNLLSGGEKALTAISMLFAIFLHKAPPFCLLDEVDAPLDDNNVRRYLSLVKEMSDKTQFILITHNKLSMEIAHNLYGVTMEEPGVSRTVSVKLHEAAEMANQKTSTPRQAQASAI